MRKVRIDEFEELKREVQGLSRRESRSIERQIERREREARSLRRARREAEEAVSLILWLVAIELIPIENRIEWVNTMQGRYAQIRTHREGLFSA